MFSLLLCCNFRHFGFRRDFGSFVFVSQLFSYCVIDVLVTAGIHYCGWLCPIAAEVNSSVEEFVAVLYIICT